MADYQNLRELLARETFPQKYVHKFIGHNSSVFLDAVLAWEATFPGAQCIGRRESGGNQTRGRYLALTYEFPAESPDDIILLLEATRLLAGLKMIL